MAEQRTIRFSGNVQGVGFRWTTQRVAAGFDVTGWVRNCSDGTVELRVEGEEETLDRFLQDLRQRMGSCIRKEQVQTAPASGTFSGFRIRH